MEEADVAAAGGVDFGEAICTQPVAFVAAAEVEGANSREVLYTQSVE